MTIEHIKINAEYNYKITQSLKRVLKTLRNRSFYMATDIISNLSNTRERNTLLQILCSAVTYAENNHYANLVKIWINNIYIRKIPKINAYFDKNSQKLDATYYIIINLAFEYKTFPVKKESIW